MKPFEEKIVDILKGGGVGVIPTDTLYGLVGRAETPEAVERIYKIRRRNSHKPCIVLISSIGDLARFHVETSADIKEFLDFHKVWPGKVSIVFPCVSPEFEYLTRGTKSIAFRIPDVPELRDLIDQVGPLIAPSANIEGERSATTVGFARISFEDHVDFYVDGGEQTSLPSTLITFQNHKMVILRQGAVKLDA